MILLEELRENGAGIHPAILSEGGLEPALKTLARRCPVPVALEMRIERRGHPNRSRLPRTTSSPRCSRMPPSTRRRPSSGRRGAAGRRPSRLRRRRRRRWRRPGPRLRSRRDEGSRRGTGRHDAGREPRRSGNVGHRPVAASIPTCEAHRRGSRPAAAGRDPPQRWGVSSSRGYRCWSSIRPRSMAGCMTSLPVPERANHWAPKAFTP